MKSKRLAGFVLIVLMAVLMFGCETAPLPAPETVYVQTPAPPPDTLVPLTVTILNRLFDTPEQMQAEIGRYQLLIFGRVFLERNYHQSSNVLGEGGRVTFEDLHIRDEITINDQTEGQAMDLASTAGEIVLSVCFEQEERFNDSQLRFSCKTLDMDGYFHLNYSTTTAAGDERGVLQYGGPEYKLKFSGEKPPYLLIKLSQRDTDRINARTASGRRVP